MTPDSGVQWARNGDARIAYKVVGDGPVDLMITPGVFVPMESFGDGVPYRKLIRPLTSFARLIMWDTRETGLSDPFPQLPPSDIGVLVDDALAVMDAAGTHRPAMFCPDRYPFFVGASLAALDPSPISHLIVLNSSARFREAPDYPVGAPDASVDAFLDRVESRWGTRWFADLWAPSLPEEDRAWLAGIQRRAISPRSAHLLSEWICGLDVRSLLGSIQIPTLVLHRSGVGTMPIAHGRYIADRIPLAYFVELEGADVLAFAGDSVAIVREIARFLTGSDVLPTPETSLRAVLFTDIVGSTGSASASGDARWRDVIEEHDAISTELVRTFSGELVKSTGDGILATFGSVAGAIACAVAIRQRMRTAGLELRAGVHAGDVALRPGDVTGTAVNIARRICDTAEGGEVWVSAAVPPLVAGSDYEFSDRGPHELKGVPGTWELYEVVS